MKPPRARSQNYGYKFGQEEETYNIVAAHGYFGRLIFQYRFVATAAAFTSSWLPGLSLASGSLPWASAFNLNGFNFNQSILDGRGRVLNTWADVLNGHLVARAPLTTSPSTWLLLSQPSAEAEVSKVLNRLQLQPVHLLD